MDLHDDTLFIPRHLVMPYYIIMFGGLHEAEVPVKDDHHSDDPVSPRMTDAVWEKARQLTAELYGETNWEDFKARFERTEFHDAAAATPEERERRHEAQVEIIGRALGVPEYKARAIARVIGPTPDPEADQENQLARMRVVQAIFYPPVVRIDTTAEVGSAVRAIYDRVKQSMGKAA